MPVFCHADTSCASVSCLVTACPALAYTRLEALLFNRCLSLSQSQENHLSLMLQAQISSAGHPVKKSRQRLLSSGCSQRWLVAWEDKPMLAQKEMPS